MPYFPGLLASIVGALAIAVVILLWLYVRAATSLGRFSNIRDLEGYTAECEQKSRAALAEWERLRADAESVKEKIVGQKVKVGQYQALLGRFQSVVELRQRIRNDKARVQLLAVTIGKLERASQLDDYLRNQEVNIASKKAELDEYGETIGQARCAAEIAAQIKYYENYLAQLRIDIEAVEEVGALHEFGFYRPRFDFETSDEYKQHLDIVRDRQKAMLKNKNACMCQTEWTVDGDKREGRKMVTQQIKLMLRAFNGECDAAVGKVRYNNVVSLENRIGRSFDAITPLRAANEPHGSCS